VCGKNYISPLILDFIDATTIADDTWTVFDTSGISDPCFMLRITNYCPSTVLISFDGAIAHEVIPTNFGKFPESNSIEVYFQTNSSPSGYVSKIKKGTKIYVQGETAVSGYIYLAGYYN